MMFARGVNHVKSSLKPPATSKAGKAAAATVVEVVVLDFDYQNKVIEVSMRESLVESALTATAAAGAVVASKNSKRAKPTATAAGAGVAGVLAVMGGRVRARVELVKPRYVSGYHACIVAGYALYPSIYLPDYVTDQLSMYLCIHPTRYLVVSLADNDNSSSSPSPSAGAVIAYLSLADYHCPHLLSTTSNPPSGSSESTPLSSLYQEGQTVTAVVVKPSNTTQPALTTQPSLTAQPSVTEAMSGLHESVAVLSISDNLNNNGKQGSVGDNIASSGATTTTGAGGGKGGDADDKSAKGMTNQEAAKVTEP